MLNAITHGSSTVRAPLLIAHGLFGSARNWGVVAKRLSATRRVTAVDMRNHGASAWTDSHRYPDMAADLAGIISERTDILGHSMGGKAAMALALTRPEALRKMVVADIAPVTYAHTQQSMIDAMRAIALDRVESRRDADAQLAERIEDAGVRAFLLQSLNVKERRWRLNLDVLEREMSRIVGFPELDGVFEGPTLFLTGAESTYVTAAHRSRIRALFPKARVVRIPGAGHWLHADRPRAFEAAVAAFLDA
ncbi:MAG: alpha/beta fold hydrolase [Boseongicola sp. SB0677_bin_26]|nr:alpha/beta fold hydrolase [Boseongicola sp. SB0665_bin_10]MYG24696.1 alpha/beta fold hydrolase [Boseongicola sp. SB0677_bin_26]